MHSIQQKKKTHPVKNFCAQSFTGHPFVQPNVVGMVEKTTMDASTFVWKSAGWFLRVFALAFVGSIVYMDRYLHLDFNDQLAFYGAYHQDWRNQIIHMIFVPLIVWSVMVWLAHVSPIHPGYNYLTFLPKTEICIDWPTFMTSALCVYYVYLEPVSGSSCAIFIIGLSLAAKWFVALEDKTGPKAVARLPKGTAWKVALVVHIMSWLAQILIGHEHFEGRKPALLDSFFQSLVMATLFVWNELLWFFGLNLELKAAVAPLILARKAAMANATAMGN
jgi:uncharacterized membrane protein YGL010W